VVPTSGRPMLADASRGFRSILVLAVTACGALAIGTPWDQGPSDADGKWAARVTPCLADADGCLSVRLVCVLSQASSGSCWRHDPLQRLRR